MYFITISELFGTNGDQIAKEVAKSLSKYPPAKPGALRLLAPQRGLIAIDQNQNREAFMVQPIANSYSRHSGESRNPVLF
jgi:hypothetical protein